jgi:hypothetical protein
MSNQPLLFVHPRDPNSMKILETLKALNKDTLCRIINIDGKQRHELPAFLKSVPTLYLPESKDLYVGSAINAFIAKPVTARREVPVQQATGGGAAPVADGYSPWSFEGKGGLSDSYSSWDLTNKVVNSDQLRYTFLGGMAPTTPTAPEPQTKQSYSGDKQGRNDDLASRLEEYKKSRDNEFKGISRQ